MLSKLFPLSLVLSAAFACSAIAQPRIGDSVIVVTDGAEVRAGEQSIAALARGQQLRVRNVSGAWLLTDITLQGQPTSGWVHSNDVRIHVQAGYAPTYQPQTQYYTPQTYYTPNYNYYQPAHTYHNTGHYHQHNGHFDYHNTGHVHHNH